jgi:hypothetical protein
MSNGDNASKIEKRIEALEDLEAIKKMKAFYGHLCDERYGKGKAELERLAEKITVLFTEDAVLGWRALRMTSMLKLTDSGFTAL